MTLKAMASNLKYSYAILIIFVFLFFCDNLVADNEYDTDEYISTDGVTQSIQITDKYSNELRGILDKFDIIMNFGRNPTASENELKPTSVISIPELCVASIDELHKIKEDFVGDDGLLSTQYTTKIYYAAKCNMLDKLKVRVFKLKNEFRLFVSELINSFKYYDLKVAHDIEYVKFLDELKDSKDKASGEHIDIINRLFIDLQYQKSHIREVLDRMEAEQKTKNDASTQRVISYLKNTHFVEAVDVFADITNQPAAIAEIVVSIYFDNEDNFGIVISFIADLESELARLYGYKAIYKHLKKIDYDSQNVNIWILAQAASDLPDSLAASVVQDVMTDLKSIVRSKDFRGIIKFVNEKGNDATATLEYILPLLIKTIDDIGKETIVIVIDIMKQLKIVRHRFHVLDELIKLMIARDKMRGKDSVSIVFEFVKLLAENDIPNWNLPEKIEKKLPNELRDLMYDNLCIQNVKYNEYLYASVPEDGYNRFIYTSPKLLMDGSFYWRMSFVKKGNKTLIVNRRDNENIYIMDSPNKKDTEDHVIGSWMSGPIRDSRAEFSLEFIGEGKFRIINDLYGQVLYSPFEDMKNERDNRPIFSKNYNSSVIALDSVWKIGICKVEVKYN